MLYQYTLTVPASTAKAAPARKELKIEYGVISYLGVGFPPGCLGLARARILLQGRQIFPVNPDEWAYWDDHVLGGSYHYPVETVPFFLTVEGYSLDDTYSHTLTILADILPPEVAEPWREPASILDKLRNMFGLGGSL